MWRYACKRLALMLPTLFLILLMNFIIIQLAPSGPLEYKLGAIADGDELTIFGKPSHTLSDEMLTALTVQYGFDKPASERFWQMVVNYASGDFGESLFLGQSVASLMAEKLPVSVLLGALTLALIYALAVPLGVYKAVHDGGAVDRATSLLLALLHAMPMFVLALMLLVLFSGGGFWQWFPMQGLSSDDYAELSWAGRVLDVAHHLVLPVLAGAVGGLASISYLTKFAVGAELARPYVRHAYALGLSARQVLYGQVLKNALLVLVAGLPALLVGVVSGNFLIEIIFGIDGMGLLAYDAMIQRDYPVMFGVLFLVSVVAMAAQLLADVAYHWLNPALNFDKMAQ